MPAKRRRSDFEVLAEVEQQRRAPKLIPIYGSAPFTPCTQCGEIHPHGIPRHSQLCCGVCHKTGEKIERRVADHTFEGDGYVRPGAETEWPDFTPPEEPKFRPKGMKRASP